MGPASVAVRKALAGHSRIAVDTAPLIYFLLADRHRAPVVRAFVEAAVKGRIEAVVSVVTELEILVAPLRERHPEALAQAERLFGGASPFSLVAVSREVARAAAVARAEHRLSLPDAVVAGTALASGCTALLGNDRAFRRLGDRVEYIHVDDLIGSGR